MEENPTAQVDSQVAAIGSRFLKYTFFKVAREWRSLPDPDSVRRRWYEKPGR